MAIDIAFIIFMLAAIMKGLRRGLIVAVFSVLACIVGLAAAIKLSAVVADQLRDSIHVSYKWLPVIAFILVFLAVVLIVRWAANLLQAALVLILLEWLNKLGGVALFIALYMAIFSILLFYASTWHILPHSMIASSRSYAVIAPWGPAVINEVGKFIPLFRDMFIKLESFFEDL